ncbi:hypothetical protein PaVLD_ORF052R [Planktothrix phage PaV-LD]|uniref:hypothetical protein n=1 Tax=Planktothrix phage PaV-LD TaxID=994601 RepID=UPI000243C8B9|nr:hypothetical protein PaVLD_ORF052R [Planktothrix phage PaV-LD]ADZ31559.1 hypothetical protein PaVLD_ORF052R [Planktothrix phage PaV-LD]
MNYRQELKQTIELFVPQVEQAFLKAFFLKDLDFGRDLMVGERTGAIDWYTSDLGSIVGNVMISMGCSSRLNAEIEKATEAIYARHGIFSINEEVVRTLELSTAKVQLKGEVNATTVQQTSSRLWVAISTFQIDCFIGL